ncbi:TetR/AcrR family transcriptional regulator [Curtobacterium sp. VKM Ac-1393]|uniref:TetR/AcrR family transcriptional regulator n=1 Tax=Curtobacterium sp. VKM Ac-1393 TaxID=2783814 RepID=UPI002B26C0E1|nr:TetR family transcriptional regulator C-terminal domain-containing protein [Curtobacterium sp. VKM Ac-1393]
MPRIRDHDAQRERLSEAVFATLAERGAGGLTLRAVAERAGCTTGLVLHAFPDKRALLLHARDVLHERTRVRSDALERDAPDAAAAVRAVVLGALPTDRATSEESRVWLGFLSAALSDPALAERHAAHSRAFVERLTRLLGAAAPAAPGNASERALALAALVEGVSSLASGDPERWTATRQRAAVELVLDAALDGS